MKNKIYLTVFLFFLLFSPFFYSGKQVAAQEIVIASPSPTLTLNVDKAKQFGVTYPIAELENCADFSSCRAYCSKSENKQACIAYAEKKGFYKRSEELARRKRLLEKARFELGCGSEVLCKRFCDIKANFERCREFSAKFKPETERARKIQEQTMVEKAKLLLGCTTPMECKTLCEEENNKQKCSDFFKQLGLRKERLEKDENKHLQMTRPLEIKVPTNVEDKKMINTLITPFLKLDEIKEASITPKPTIAEREEKQEVKGISSQSTSFKESVIEAFKSFLHFMMYGTSK